MARKKKAQIKLEKTVEYFTRKELNNKKMTELKDLVKLYKLKNVQINDKEAIILRLLKIDKSKVVDLQKKEEVKKEINRNQIKINEIKEKFAEIDEKIQKVINKAVIEMNQLLAKKMKETEKMLEFEIIQTQLKESINDNKR